MILNTSPDREGSLFMEYFTYSTNNPLEGFASAAKDLPPPISVTGIGSLASLAQCALLKNDDRHYYSAFAIIAPPDAPATFRQSAQDFFGDGKFF